MFREWSRSLFISLLTAFVLIMVELAVCIVLLAQASEDLRVTHTVPNPAYVKCLRAATARNPQICDHPQRIPDAWMRP